MDSVLIWDSPKKESPRIALATNFLPLLVVHYNLRLKAEVSPNFPHYIARRSVRIRSGRFPTALNVRIAFQIFECLAAFQTNLNLKDRHVVSLEGSYQFPQIQSRSFGRRLGLP